MQSSFRRFFYGRILLLLFAVKAQFFLTFDLHHLVFMDGNFNRAEFNVLQNTGNLTRDFSDLLFFAAVSCINTSDSLRGDSAIVT